MNVFLLRSYGCSSFQVSIYCYSFISLANIQIMIETMMRIAKVLMHDNMLFITADPRGTCHLQALNTAMTWLHHLTTDVFVLLRRAVHVHWHRLPWIFLFPGAEYSLKNINGNGTIIISQKDAFMLPKYHHRGISSHIQYEYMSPSLSHAFLPIIISLHAWY